MYYLSDKKATQIQFNFFFWWIFPNKFKTINKLKEEAPLITDPPPSGSTTSSIFYWITGWFSLLAAMSVSVFASVSVPSQFLVDTQMMSVSVFCQKYIVSVLFFVDFRSKKDIRIAWLLQNLLT